MAGQRTSFGKLQRDGAKRAKAAAKREKRQDRDPAAGEAQEGEDGAGRAYVGPVRSSAELLAEIEALHQSFDAGTVSYEDFEEKKADLLGRLSID